MKSPLGTLHEVLTSASELLKVAGRRGPSSSGTRRIRGIASNTYDKNDFTCTHVAAGATGAAGVAVAAAPTVTVTVA